MADYPEHEKLKAVKDRSQCVGSFIEWLGEQGLTICDWTEGNFDNWHPTHEPIEKLLARFFEIDLNKIEAEKQQMLAELRGEEGGS